MTERVSPHRGLKPNRPALVAVLVTGCGVGLSPYARFLQRWDRTAIVVGVLFVAVAILTAFKSVSDEPTSATDPPGLVEWLLGIGMATGNAIVASLIGFLFYAAGFWALRLWNLFASGGPLPQGNPEAWGFWFSFPFVVVLGLAMVGVAAERLTPLLYPSRPLSSRRANTAWP